MTLLSSPRSYGRVYATADPYHHTIGPAATYSVGTMVSPPRRRLFPVCSLECRNTSAHTCTLMKIKSRGRSGRWSLLLFIHQLSSAALLRPPLELRGTASMLAMTFNLCSIHPPGHCRFPNCFSHQRLSVTSQSLQDCSRFLAVCVPDQSDETESGSTRGITECSCNSRRR